MPFVLTPRATPAAPTRGDFAPSGRGDWRDCQNGSKEEVADNLYCQRRPIVSGYEKRGKRYDTEKYEGTGERTRKRGY